MSSCDYRILQSKYVVEEFIPYIVLDAAKITPVNGFVIKPVNPATAPLNAPSPPSYRNPQTGC